MLEYYFLYFKVAQWLSYFLNSQRVGSNLGKSRFGPTKEKLATYLNTTARQLGFGGLCFAFY